ncbi:MAG: hypothetical protein ABIP89_09825 [Polyangiaceae bacterium]
MDAQRIVVKLYLEDRTVAPHDFIPVFHRWIQTKALDEVLIDVVDYSHVHDGPGVLLICHEANYAMDLLDGRPGLVYARKRDVAGTWEERIRSSFGAALTACRKIEGEVALAGKSRFATNELLFRINDRLLAPNVPATFAEVAPILSQVCARLYGETAFELTHEPGRPDELFTVRIRATGEAPSVKTLLERL